MARRLRDAVEPLATHPYWARLVNEQLAACGLNFLSGYVWGRAAPMGEPAALLVASAFAAFEPGLITSLYEEGRRTLKRDELIRIQEAATATSLHNILGDVDVHAVVATLQRGIEAADGTGRPMFAGLRSLPTPADPLAQLWRTAQMVREHRGDSHIAVYISAGFDPVQMNILTELWVGWPLGTFSATRAWPQERTDRALRDLHKRGLIDGDRLSDVGRSMRTEIEERTDALEQPLVMAIGPEIDRTIDQLNAWAQKVISAGDFPPDPRKRAAG
ncbi:MAG: hypothetical protein NVSMB22_16820 [Chloroflexota bacterium]